MAEPTLYDIVGPAAPPPMHSPVAWLWVLPSAAVLMLALLAAILVHRGRWRRRLHRMSSMPPRKAAFAAAALLRARWRLVRLDATKPPAGRDPAAWRALIEALDDARYRVGDPGSQIPVQELRQWL